MINKLLIILLVFCCCGACWENQRNNVVYVYPYNYQYVQQPYYVRPYVEQKVVWVPFVENRVYYAQPVVYWENVQQQQQSYGTIYSCGPVMSPSMWVRYNY